MDECFLKDNSHILDWLVQREVKINVSLFLTYCLCKNNYHGIRWLFKNFAVQPRDCTDAIKFAGIYAKWECKDELECLLDGLVTNDE